MPKETHHTHMKYYISTTRETLKGQSSPSKSWEGKVKESLVGHNVADKCLMGGKIQLNKQHTNHGKQAHQEEAMK